MKDDPVRKFVEETMERAQALIEAEGSEFSFYALGLLAGCACLDDCEYWDLLKVAERCGSQADIDSLLKLLERGYLVKTVDSPPVGGHHAKQTD